MSKFSDWLSQLSLQDPTDQSFVEDIDKLLSSHQAICLYSPDINRSLCISAEAIKRIEAPTIWVNFAACTSELDAMLCLAEAFQTFQGTEAALIQTLAQKSMVIIAQQLPVEAMAIVSMLTKKSERSQWIILSAVDIKSVFHTIDIPSTSINLPPPKEDIDNVLITLPGGLPIEYQGSLNVIRCGDICLADPRYALQQQSSNQNLTWLTEYLDKQLNIYQHLSIPDSTTILHYFALDWLQKNSHTPDIIQRSRIAMAMILQAWKQPQRALLIIQNTPLGLENPQMLVSGTLLQITINVLLGHWEQVPILSKRTLQLLRSNTSLTLRGEFRRQLANIYAKWGKQSLAEKELQQALRLSERTQATTLRSRVLRDIAALGIANKESIAPALLLEQVNCEGFSSHDYAHYLVTKSDLLQHREDKQAAEIALNQAESIDNETPLSIANRQRRRATIAFAAGKYDAALKLARKARHRFYFAGEHLAQVHSTRLIADILACQGQAQNALEEYRQAISIHLALRDNYGLSKTLRNVQVLLQHQESALAQDIDRFIDKLGVH